MPIAWGMCNGNSADNTINTCNGGDCTKFIEENGQNGRVLIDQPALWTENWMGSVGRLNFGPSRPRFWVTLRSLPCGCVMVVLWACCVHVGLRLTRALWVCCGHVV